MSHSAQSGKSPLPHTLINPLPVFGGGWGQAVAEGREAGHHDAALVGPLAELVRSWAPARRPMLESGWASRVGVDPGTSL